MIELRYVHDMRYPGLQRLQYRVRRWWCWSAWRDVPVVEAFDGTFRPRLMG